MRYHHNDPEYLWYFHRNSRWQRLAAGILTALLLAIAIAAVAYGLITLIGAAKEMLVATIAGAASLLSAVFAYVFQRTKDIELAAIQRERELELADIRHRRELEHSSQKHSRDLEVAARKTKQENYARVLERLAPYVRNPTVAADDFTTAYLHTWVMGSPSVIRAVQAFLTSRNYDSLDKLLLAMRSDLMNEPRMDNSELVSLTSQGLFPPPPPAPAAQGLN